jgi:hypothetical protein
MGFEMRSKKFAQKTKKFGISTTETRRKPKAKASEAGDHVSSPQRKKLWVDISEAP